MSPSSTREEESRRIARDLHDDITQRLALLSVDLAAAASRPEFSGDPAGTGLNAFRNRVLEIGESVRGISHQLHPAIVDTLGLSASLEALCRDFFDHEGVPVRFHSGTLLDDIPADIACCLYRVTQEALHNVTKHARAQGVKVSVEIVDQAVQLQVIDSGVGFDTSVTTTGLGLQSMRERVELVSGSFSIESALGSGTRILVNVPLDFGLKARFAD